MSTQIRGGNNGSGTSQIKPASIDDSDIHASAAIVTTKLADGANFILRGGSVAFTADQSMGGFKLTNVDTPTAGGDAANKTYVDSVASGLDPKSSVRLATAAALPANTRSTNTLTASGNGALSVDGVTVVAGDRILVKNEATGANNGLYVVTTVGTAGTPFVLDRAGDADVSAEVNAGMFVFVEEGTANADSGWVLTTNNLITLNTTALTFSQFSSAVLLGFATNAIVLGTSAAAGVATTTMRSDDTIAAFDATAPTTSAVGDTAAVGSVAKAARRDHVHGREAFATPAIVLGTAAAAGSAATPIRSDSTIVAFDATAPSTQAIGDSAAVGAAAVAARRDHKHAMPAYSAPTGTASRPGDTNAAGSGTALVREDHKHLRENWAIGEVPSGAINGSNKTFTLANTPNPSAVKLYWNGLRMKATVDYALATATVTIDSAVAAPISGDLLLADYIY